MHTEWEYTLMHTVHIRVRKDEIGQENRREGKERDKIKIKGGRATTE